MKTKNILILLIGVFVLSALVFQNCKKEDEPNKAPGCEITSPSDGEELTQGEIVTISVAATDSDGSITAVWFIIDGENKSTVNSSPYNYDWNTSGERIGNHTIKATSYDNGGASTSDELTIEVIKEEGSAFTATPTSGDAPLTVNFTDQSTNNPTSWHWDFGDGNNSSEQNPSHTYNDMGQYDVALTTTNQSGSDTETKTSFILVKGIFTDPRDDQTYSIVTIGSQIWFAENLNYETADSWWYNDDEANGDVYGRLYTWDAAMIACPGGWYLPSDNEWKILEMYLGMSQSDADGEESRGTDEGIKLKSTSGWGSSGNGTDEVGFKALPGGYYYHNDDSFFLIGTLGSWWTNTENIEQNWKAWRRFMFNIEDGIGRTKYDKYNGYSVRCIKSD